MLKMKQEEKLHKTKENIMKRNWIKLKTRMIKFKSKKELIMRKEDKKMTINVNNLMMIKEKDYNYYMMMV